ncbi:lipoprotein, putative [Synechococcus sp. CC9311]|nr:lipoprotein, putative [Synechococcus sp. CC9311]
MERHAQASWLDPVMLDAHLGQILTGSCFQDECVV